MTASASMPSVPVPMLPPSASVGIDLRTGGEHGELGFASYPVRHDGFDGAHIGESQPLHFAQGPGHGGLVARRPGGTRADLGGQRFHQGIGGRVGEGAFAQRGRGREVGAREAVGLFGRGRNGAESQQESCENRGILFVHVAALIRSLGNGLPF